MTDLQRLSALICAQTSVIREFIDEQLPWFQYQEWTWLAIGIITVIKVVCDDYIYFAATHSTLCSSMTCYSMKWSCRYYWYTAAADPGSHPHLPREEDQNLHRHHQGSKQVSTWLSSVVGPLHEL